MGAQFRAHSNSNFPAWLCAAFRLFPSSRGTVFPTPYAHCPPSHFHFHACAPFPPLNQRLAQPAHSRRGSTPPPAERQLQSKTPFVLLPAALLCYHPFMVVHGCALPSMHCIPVMAQEWIASTRNGRAGEGERLRAFTQLTRRN